LHGLFCHPTVEQKVLGGVRQVLGTAGAEQHRCLRHNSCQTRAM
jgi:hypothetical protein